MRVAIGDVKRIQIREVEGVCRALVSINNGEQIALNVDGRIPLSGRSLFGEYRIPLARISDISLYLENGQNSPARTPNDFMAP